MYSVRSITMTKIVVNGGLIVSEVSFLRLISQHNTVTIQGKLRADHSNYCASSETVGSSY